jgi:uncharacterized protein (DUF2237 family)
MSDARAVLAGLLQVCSVSPPVVLDATHARALQKLALAGLEYHALGCPDFRGPDLPGQDRPT